jgi:DNA-binding response OmpR family regulator
MTTPLTARIPTMNVDPRPRVLIAEDESMVAMLLEDLMDAAGYGVLLAPSLSDGLAIAASESFHAAILDVTLGRENSFPLADELQRRNIPFLFASGYGADHLPERFRDCLVLQKPYDMKSLRKALSEMLGT